MTPSTRSLLAAAAVAHKAGQSRQASDFLFQAIPGLVETITEQARQIAALSDCYHAITLEAARAARSQLGADPIVSVEVTQAPPVTDQAPPPPAPSQPTP